MQKHRIMVAAAVIIIAVCAGTRAADTKATRLVGWAPRSSEEAIVAAGESLVQLGLVAAAPPLATSAAAR